MVPVPQPGRPWRAGRGRAVAVTALTAVAIALPAPARAAPTAAGPSASAAGGAPFFLRYPTDQLGVPGAIETAELTPQGSLFTGRLELALRAGRAMRPWGDAVPRTLAGDGTPVHAWSRRVDGADVRATAFAVEAAGVPVVHLRLELTGRGTGRRPFHLGLDVGWLGQGLREELKGDLPRAPYRFPRNVASAGAGLLEQPGDPFDPAWTSTWTTGGVLGRSGSPLLAARVVPADRAAGVLVRRTTAPAPRPDDVAARLRVDGALRAGQRRRIDVVVPLRAVPAGHPALADRHDDGLARLRRTWRPVLDRGMRIETPEPAVDTAWRAGILAMLVPRHRLPDGRWVQTPNKFQYQASWIRDTTMIAHALDLLGFRREAGEDVEFLTRWQDGTGLLQSRVGQYDGMGQALWSFGDHVARSGDLAMARRLLPAVDAATAWIAERLALDPRWILPPSDPRDDNEHVPGHATGDLVWLAGGTRRVVALAEALGDEDRAEEWRALADRVADVARARTAEAARDGVVPPVLDADGGRRWGEMWMAWPTALLPATHPLVRATSDAAAADEREGLALWGGRLHLYLGLRRLHTELLAGRRPAVVDGLYATLAHLTSTGGTWEQGTAPLGSREVYRALGPHGWASADLLSLLHDMLVREDGDAVRLLDVLPPSWLRAGRTTRVLRARTAHGSVDVSLRTTRTGAVLRWSAAVPADVPLVFRAPDAVRRVRLPGVAPGRREIVLPGRRGTMRLRWTPGPTVLSGPDAVSTREGLRAAYAARARRR
ncbi:unannotated protein [freshwater metagenome]|uniref:Unannotated protein n=1 Tax=freshwater metagenome TaxID=449393 RepID=A0A6J7H362_9ZZZZ|nr:hypothetical protein [Actinomycetota bacterium]